MDGPLTVSPLGKFPETPTISGLSSVKKALRTYCTESCRPAPFWHCCRMNGPEKGPAFTEYLVSSHIIKRTNKHITCQWWYHKRRIKMAGTFRCGCDVARRVRWLGRAGGEGGGPGPHRRTGGPGEGLLSGTARLELRADSKIQGAWKRSWKAAGLDFKGLLFQKVLSTGGEGNLFFSKNRLQ